ncbi:MAG: hypothetical protein OJF52_003172 [Nitrospira sp.]|jgi:anti-sigma factor ChrR (cupin superfamily)|nr:MAG: hypothetical protein OJF52_003172 [Nitrospira sp.]
MIHRQLTDELRDLALGYAMGSLSPTQAAAVEKHLTEGCELCAQEVRASRLLANLLLTQGAFEQPPPELRDRLLSLIHAEAQEQAVMERGSDDEAGSIPSGWTIARATDGRWESGDRDGSASKLLSHDAAECRRTMLVQLEAGGCYPGFHPADTVELYLIDGNLRLNGELLVEGDFCALPAGTNLSHMVSPGGCHFILLRPDRAEEETADQGGLPFSSLIIVRAAEGSWLAGPAEGVAVKPLFNDPVRGTATYLVRAEPGSRLSRHRHVTADQTFLLEGDGRMGTRVIEAGDFYRAEPGTVHEVSWTDRGCLCLTIASISEPID